MTESETRDLLSSHTGTASAWSTFGKGLTQPTLPSLTITVLVATLICYWAATAVNESWMADYGILFSMGDNDVHAQVTQDAISLKIEAPKSDLLAIAGHLDSRRLTCEDWDQLSVSMDGSEPRAVDLRTPQQTIYESFALLDQVPWSTARQAILVVTAASFCRDTNAASEMEDRSKIGVRSVAATVESLRRGAPAVPFRGNYFIDNQSYLLSRAPIFARNVLAKQFGLESPRLDIAVPQHPFSDVARTDPSVVQENINSLGRLLQRLHFRGFRAVMVVFHADPTNVESDLRWRAQTIAEQNEAQFVLHLPSDDSAAGLPLGVLRNLREQAQ